MQYLLTEKEYQDLKEKASRSIRKEVLQDLCVDVANHLPIIFWGTEEKQPWTCILTNRNRDWFCDECPARHACPNENKRFHK